jgi:cysteinyl-tRNA synthetase
VQQLIDERTQARARREWKRADELRAAIGALGWSVEDKADGPRVTRKER